MPGKCLLESSATVLPPELEGVLDNLLDQLKGLLDLGLSQWCEVHHPHIHLRTPRGVDTHTHTTVLESDMETIFRSYSHSSEGEKRNGN